jgi:hypothetical protein
MRKFLLILILILTGVTFAHASSEPVKNAGFVPANIWYSKESFFAGETVRIYTVIFNGSTYDLSGGVEFLDNSVSLAQVPFAILATGQAEDVSIPWKATEGKHTITARVINTSVSSHGGTKTPIALENDSAGASDITVAIDPAVVAANAKAVAEKSVEVGTQVAGQVGGVIQTVDNAIPVPIKEGTTASVNAVEAFRTTLENQFRAAKDDKGRQLEVLNARTATTTAKIEQANKKAGIVSTISGYTEKPFTYVMYALFALLQYFFKWWIIFYAVAFYIIYRLFKWGIQKIRNQ